MSNYQPTPSCPGYTHWFYPMLFDVSNANGTTYQQTSYDRVYVAVPCGEASGTGEVRVDPSGATGAGTITLSIDTDAADGNISTTAAITIKASSE